MRNSLLITCSLVLFAAPAAAQAPLLTGLGGPRDFGTSCLHHNDDESSPEIDLRTAFPSGLRFFDRTHTKVFVNTNGNISFNGPVSTYTPLAFPVADQPMIAPYWADVDTRRSIWDWGGGPCPNPTTNGVWWHLEPPHGAEPGRMIVTWDRVGYFDMNTDRLMSFQLILTAVPSCGGGATDFDVEFRFNRCEWTIGDVSSAHAQSGFDAGNKRR